MGSKKRLPSARRHCGTSWMATPRRLGAIMLEEEIRELQLNLFVCKSYMNQKLNSFVFVSNKPGFLYCFCKTIARTTAVSKIIQQVFF